MSKADRLDGARRARVAQALVMQGGIAVILLLLAWLSRADTRSALLYVATLLVPAGWTYGLWTGHRREEAARAERRWDAELQKRERRRALGILGGTFAAWLVLAVAIVLLV